ncbi:MAG: hypothetical protein WDN08_18915 [Rhizomicrobium sp.]
MRAILLGAALALTTIVPALADDAAIMASRFGNTTITRDAAGTENRIYYAADGSFTGKQGAAAFKGTWKIANGTICLTADPPIPNTPNPTCAPISEHKVGESWSAGPYTIALVAGIQ